MIESVQTNSAETLQVDLENLIGSLLRQYRNKHVLIRECIQNSVDAGATRIEVTVNERGILVEDNGVGMNLEEIRKFWNTIGRTGKRPGKSIGEFGLGRLTLLLVSDTMHMETRKDGYAFHVTTDRQGHVNIKEGNREQKGTTVWVECQLASLVQELLSYGRIVAKARLEQILLNGKLVSQGKYQPLTSALSSTNVAIDGITGCIWIPAEAPAKARHKEREATIRIYCNNLFVKNLATDYYVFGEINCDNLRVVTSRDDFEEDDLYTKFHNKLLEFIETQFYSQIASSSLINDSRTKNDILIAASRRGDRTLLENMLFETPSGEKLKGKDIMARKDVFVVSETNPKDLELADKFHQLGVGVSIIAPTGLKNIMSQTLGTIGRSEVSSVVIEKLTGKPASRHEEDEFQEVKRLVADLCGLEVELRKEMQAAAECAYTKGKIAISIEAREFTEARDFLRKNRKDLAMVRVLAVVAHEMAHVSTRGNPVHDVRFYQEFETMIEKLHQKLIKFLQSTRR